MIRRLVPADAGRRSSSRARSRRSPTFIWQWRKPGTPRRPSTPTLHRTEPMKTLPKWTVCQVLLAGLTAVAGTATAQARPRFLNPATLPPSRGYTQVVEVPAGERMVYVSGQVPLDRSGNLVGGGDFRRQAEQVFVNLERALAAAGATFADVVKINYYIRDVSHLADLRAVRDQHVSTTSPPASTLVEVSHLFRDDVLLEVEAVAAVGSR
jgi:enamine deaminase RidA (YjgF/YER057c/UK114 family)